MNVFTDLKKQLSLLIKLLFLIILFGMVVTAFSKRKVVTAIFSNSNQIVTKHNLVIIDAGHGAEDSGKVAVNGVLEKDINLTVAKMVRDLLELQDVHVMMTREDERGFYPKTGNNKKLRDLQSRVNFINENAPDLIVSVHQNSFSDPAICGAQTFYYKGSKEGKKAAVLLQDQFAKLDSNNHRKAKENDSYCLLKNSEYPSIIAECGFLSNPNEAEKLCDEAYQRRIAWAIHMGIMQYLNGGTNSEVDKN